MARVQAPSISERAFKIPVFTDVLNAGINGYEYMKNYHSVINSAMSLAEGSASGAWRIVIASQTAKTIEEKYKLSTTALRAANASLDFIEKAVANLPKEDASKGSQNLTPDQTVKESEEEPPQGQPEDSGSEPESSALPESATPLVEGAKMDCTGYKVKGVTETLKDRLRPFTLLFMALAYEINRQLFTIDRRQALYDTACKRSEKLRSNGNAVYEGATKKATELTESATCYRDSLYEKTNEVKDRIMPQVESAKGSAATLAQTAYEAMETGKEKVGPYAALAYESAKPYIPTVVASQLTAVEDPVVAK